MNIYKEIVSCSILALFFCRSISTCQIPKIIQNPASERNCKALFVIISRLRNFSSNRTFVRMNASHSSRQNCPRGDDDDAE